MHPQDLTGSARAGDLTVTATVKTDTEPLDTDYRLSPQEATFFKRETGIDDDDDLRTHILKVQEEAFKVFPYGCIKALSFLRLGISTLPEYETLLKLGKERPDGILLDVGSFFGVDARKAAADGFPLKNIVTTDLMKEFYDMGHALFNTTRKTYPINFVHGDVFHPNTLQIVPPLDELPLTERPNLSALTSLNPLAGHCTVIYASNVFHLFSDEKQLHLAKGLAGLLSPQPGSIICGIQLGNWQKGVFNVEVPGWSFGMFQHSPESWRAVWDGDVFPKGSTRVEVTLLEWRSERSATVVYPYLRWSVVRL